MYMYWASDRKTNRNDYRGYWPKDHKSIFCALQASDSERGGGRAGQGILKREEGVGGGRGEKNWAKREGGKRGVCRSEKGGRRQGRGR